MRIGSYGYDGTYGNVGVDVHRITLRSGHTETCVMEFAIVLGDGVQKVAVGEEMSNGILYVMGLRVHGGYGLRDKFQSMID